MQECEIHEQPIPGGGRIVIVGDDQRRIEDAFDEFTGRTSAPDAAVVNADGGRSRVPDVVGTYERESTVTRSDLDAALGDSNARRAVLAFREGDRERFFRTLRSCREHGLEAVVPADQAEKVLVAETRGEWVVADFEPLSPRQRRLKRLFDIAFALIGLIALAPVIVVIAVAIKCDSRGPVLYRQRRSGLYGRPFTCYKFRSMYTESENPIPEDDAENDRITRVGRVLRKTHMDEIPQLWPILRGEMSTIGPRAAWVEEEELIERELDEWRKRWFVKPGLTGLAQINEISSTSAAAKLRYDLEYARHQSFALDVRIVAVQFGMVLLDMIELLARTGR